MEHCAGNGGTEQGSDRGRPVCVQRATRVVVTRFRSNNSSGSSGTTATMFGTLGIATVLLAAVLHLTVAKEIAIRNRDVPQYKERPEWLRQCRRANPNEDDCFKKMFEGTFPYIAKGIPEIGVQPFDPLRIESIQVSRGSGGLTLSGGFKKLSIKGPSNTTVRRASLDFGKKVLAFDLEIPKLRIDAVYNLKGNVLLLPLVGDGDVTMTLKNVKTAVVTKFAVRPLPEDAIFIEEMKVTFLVGGMRIHLDNLFQGNQVLGASLNLFLNQNAAEVIAELRSDLEYGLADIFTGLWNELFNKLPLKLWLS
ncbi:protein takeout-like [Anopheles darlingi]|uniref:protein takeout-like n=1 Tax=Anopheles darlingi TaxID=43151 RepID=UPI0021000D88|nr:protein takeout-like [Anopheles darlingi]